MANNYKNIVITPNTGSATGDPTVVFSGGNTTVNTDVTLRVYPESNGTISFEGSAGQLFSITNDLSNSIFSVNDVSGIPLIEVNVSSQQITLGEFYGNVGIGKTSSTSSIYKLDVNGTINASNVLINGSPITGVANLTPANGYVNTSTTAANNYAGFMANAANAYATTINDANLVTARAYTNTSTTAANNYAGVMANAANAYATTINDANLVVARAYTNTSVTAANNYASTIVDANLVTARAYTNTSTTAANNYAGVMANSVNAYANTLGTNTSLAYSWTNNHTFSANVFYRNTSNLVWITNSASTTSNVTLRNYPDSNGTLSFEGSAGQLFSITNDLTGSIFAVNDVSGIPLIEVNVASQQITLGQFYGNVGIGTGAANSSIYKLDITGSANISSPTLLVAGQNVIASFASINAYAVAVGTSGNAYTVVVGASGNAYANVVGTAANNYAGAMANSGNSWTQTIVDANLVTARAYTNTSTTSANNYAGVMANSANAVAVATFGTITNTTAAFAAANSKVASVSGTSGRITSSGGTTPAIDLATAGAGAASYSSGISAVTVDAYGRVTAVTGSAGYVTSSGVTSVASGTGLTGGPITSTGTLSVDFATVATATNTTAAFAAANGVATNTTAAFASSNSKVASVSGTSGRITSSGGTTPAIDLATAGAGAASYSSGISAVTVDAYGRVTSVTGSAGYVTSSGVTSVATGTGLTGGTITSTGTLSVDFTTVATATNTTAAFAAANGVATNTTAAFAAANQAGVIANNVTANTTAAFTAANQAGVIANAAFNSANSVTTNTTAAFAAANSKVASVSGTSGRITSSGGTTPAIDLATAGAGAASYSSGISAVTVDAYGRVTAVTGSAGYVTSSGVTSVATGTGLTGGTITSTGTLSVDFATVATATNTTAAFAAANGANTFANTTYVKKAGDTISGDLVVQGNLTTSGVVTYANTQTLLIGDALITLNNDIPAAVAPSEDAGVEVKRGSSANVALLWNEGSDRWTFTNDGTNYRLIASNTDIQSANNYAGAMANSGNAYAQAVGAAGNTYAQAVGTAGNTYAGTVVTNANTYAQAVGAAGNAYTNVVGASGNAWASAAFTTTTNGVAAFAYANGVATNTTAAFAAANSKVASVSGTSGRITSSGGTTPAIDLATAGAGAATYSSGISSVTVDAYGRVTAVTGSAGYVTSSGVTSVATGVGLTGGTITSTGTVSLATYSSGTNAAVSGGISSITVDEYGRVRAVSGSAGYLTSAVTSVATGTGLTGGTITSTGTLSVDFATVATATNTTAAFAAANGKVASVSGTSGRITSSGGTTPAIDLATAGAGAATYSSGISSVTVDAYGRVTSVTGSAGYVTSSGVTSVSGTGTVSGLTLSGTVTSTGSLTLGGTLSASVIDNMTDEHRLFNNMGDNHGTRTAFDATSPSYNFGWRYVQGNTNGPGVNSATQYYSEYVGLGNEYPATGAGSYGMHIAYPRNVTTPYISIRYVENNALGAWQKISAGYADAAPWSGITGKPTTISGFGITDAVTSVTGTSGRITSSGGTTPAIDLATAGAGAATYSSGISSVTVDAYGRVTAVTGSAGYATTTQLNSYLPLAGGTLTGRVIQSASGFGVGTDDTINSRIDSGFWQTSNAQTANGWPESTATWYHLITSTHSNDANYYSMQFAGSFFDSNALYYRATNNSGTTAWNKLWHAGNDGSGSGLDADTVDGIQASSFYLASNPSGYVTSSGVTSITAGTGLSGGTITSTGTISLPSTGPGAGSYSSGISAITLDAQGRVTAITGSAGYATTSQLSSYAALSGAVFTGLITGKTDTAANTSVANDTGSMSIRGSTTAPATVSFHRAGAYAVNMGLDTDNVFRIGGWSDGVNTYRLQLGTPGGTHTFNGSISDSHGSVRRAPVDSKSSQYTLVATDTGKTISITTGGIIVPANVMSAGDIVTIFNNSGSSQTITTTGTTAYFAGTATTGDRTLLQRGVANILCVASNVFVISGSGLT